MISLKRKDIYEQCNNNRWWCCRHDAAIIAARNGHTVTLMEKTKSLGKSFLLQVKADVTLPMPVMKKI